MYAREQFVVLERSDALTVPRNAIVDLEGTRGVFVADGNTARFKPIRSGIVDGDAVEITDCLADGSTVITLGSASLRDGEGADIVELYRPRGHRRIHWPAYVSAPRDDLSVDQGNERLVHGSVMESIFYVCTVNKGERATAGILYGWLYDKKTRHKYGGLVCELYGDHSISEIERRLHASLEELYTNGYSDEFELKDRRLITESFVPEKKYGTALAALCFVNYHYPILRVNENA